MRIGPKMQMVADFVARNPGLAMRAAAHHVNPSPSPDRCESYGYDVVHRAIDAGLVTTAPGPRGSTLLFPVSAKES